MLFLQLHFLNGNTRHRKASKNSTLFKNNKMVFLYLFFPYTTIILFQVAIKLEKRNWEMVFIFILRLIARRFISKTKAHNQENGNLQDYPEELNLS